MKITIRHEISALVGPGAQRAVEHLLLTPLSGPSQTVKDWSIDVPGIETAARFTDAFGNRALLLDQTKPEEELSILVTGTVETHDNTGVLGRVPGEPVVALYRRVTDATKPDPRLVEAAREAERSGSGRIALFHAVMGRIGELYRFAGGQPVATQTQSQSAAGQSQTATSAKDEPPAAEAATFAHAFIGTMRALDIPARYVTGYLAAEDDRPAAFHAWAEAWDDSLGWIAFDAALGVSPTDRHVRIATGLDAATTTPVRIVPTGGAVTLGSVAVTAQ
jgi:transglutaminase-like putative cysteine protease